MHHLNYCHSLFVTGIIFLIPLISSPLILTCTHCYIAAQCLSWDVGPIKPRPILLIASIYTFGKVLLQISSIFALNLFELFVSLKLNEIGFLELTLYEQLEAPLSDNE